MDIVFGIKQTLDEKCAPSLAGGEADAHVLWKMLIGQAESEDPLVNELHRRFGTRPAVAVRAAGPGKGRGVFACKDLPAGTYFSTYPVHYMYIVKNDGTQIFVRSFFWCSHEQRAPPQTVEYAVPFGIYTQAGKPVAAIGHPDYDHALACGHLCNDALTLAEAGSEAAYLADTRCNCVPEWQPSGAILMKTTKRVRKGEELLYKYGVRYWEGRAWEPGVAALALAAEQARAE